MTSNGAHRDAELVASVRGAVETLKAQDAAPVSAAHRARLWAGVEARLAGEGAPRRATRWAVAFGAAAVAGVAMWLLWPSAPSEVAIVEVVAEAQPRRVEMGTVAAVELQARARARLEGTHRVELLEGAADFDVRKRPPGKVFTVRAHDVNVVVVGTRFRVSRGYGERVQVEVSEGLVRVEQGARSWFVGAGEVWPTPVASPRRAPQPPTPTPDVVEPSARALIAQAQALAASSRLQEARERLKRAAEVADGESGELALYLRARLEARRLGRHDLAAKTLAELRRRFPVTRFAREVATSELESALALRQCAAARRARERLVALKVPASELPSFSELCADEP